MHASGWSLGRSIHYALEYTWIGLIVGTLVGWTSVGGGSLLTPLLILVPPHMATLGAVATDFLHSVAVKFVGWRKHRQLGNIDHSVVLWLSLGSVPATFITSVLVGSKHSSSKVVVHILGIVLIVSAALFLIKPLIERGFKGAKEDRQLSSASIWLRRIVTALLGAGVGTLVGLTSVGSGALIMLVIAFMYPAMSAQKLVGTDILQSLLMLGAGSLGYLATFSVQWNIVGALLMGSLPGVLLGTWLSKKTHPRVLVPILALVLAFSGYLLINK
ncbi:sulfite exporter TauE/SafE family protein [Reticulibacter mediterranei]|nr:sulfite exporter TauE/SafE family protein [Reticulibacter mediterranei]